MSLLPKPLQGSTRCKQIPYKCLFSIKMGCGLPPAGHSWSSLLWGRVPRPSPHEKAGDPEREQHRLGWASRGDMTLPGPAHLDTAGSCLQSSKMSWVLRKSAQQGRQQSSNTSTPRCRMTPTCFLFWLPNVCVHSQNQHVNTETAPSLSPRGLQSRPMRDRWPQRLLHFRYQWFSNAAAHQNHLRNISYISDISLLGYRNATNFSILILYLSTLLN